MPKKSLVLTLVAHQPYIRCPAKDEVSPEIEMLFSSISDTYIPLLNMFEKLDVDSVPFNISMVLTPTLCELLADYEVQQRYIAWLEQGIALGQAELDSLSKDNPRYALAEQCLNRIIKTKDDYTSVYKADLLSAFRYYADRGSIELLATAATFAFLPHYIDIPEAINAQIEAGLLAHRHFFGVIPDGFWLPSMGYNDGLEQILRNYGFTYTVLDSHGLLFSKPCPYTGIFAPARCENGLVLFARDFSVETQVSGNEGYIRNPVYRDQDRDLAFEADADELKDFISDNGARKFSGYKYWNQAGDEFSWYDSDKAKKQIIEDAKDFVSKKTEMLNKAEVMLETSDLSLVCTFDAKIFGQRWHEGVEWLEQVIREISSSDDITTAHIPALIKDKEKLPVVNPFMSATNGTGYGEDILETSNDWILQYSRKASEQMIHLAERFPKETGLKERVLNTATKELLLAQSIDWPMMIHDKFYPEYAENQFKENIKAFNNVYESLGATSISTEWLTNMEQKHPLFPWVNYQIFREKK